MKNLAVSALIVFSFAGAVSCSKHTSGPYPGAGPNSLWPLKAGNTWYYADSVFSNTGLTGMYPDTIVVNQTLTRDGSGAYYFGINNPNGWFGNGTYISVDPNNYTVWEADTPNYSPYIFFQQVPADGTIIGTGNDFSTSCPLYSTQYGFATPVTINGYSCLKNIEYVTNCNNFTVEGVVTYVSPGTGVVRMEDYVADSTNGNKLYLDFSQTLQSKSLH